MSDQQWLTVCSVAVSALLALGPWMFMVHAKLGVLTTVVEDMADLVERSCGFSCDKEISMSDKMRWRYGDTNPVVASVDAGTVIEIGDLLWQDVDDAKPASDLLPRPGEEPVQLLERFAAAFLGVAMQRSRAGDTAPVRVATTGVFEFDLRQPCPCELGEGIAPALGDSPPGRLQNQGVRKIDLAAGRQVAIARIARREARCPESILIDIRSTVMTGGVVCR